jgi:hypothetical protein
MLSGNFEPPSLALLAMPLTSTASDSTDRTGRRTPGQSSAEVMEQLWRADNLKFANSRVQHVKGGVKVRVVAEVSCTFVPYRDYCSSSMLCCLLWIRGKLLPSVQ